MRRKIRKPLGKLTHYTCKNPVKRKEGVGSCGTTYLSSREAPHCPSCRASAIFADKKDL